MSVRDLNWGVIDTDTRGWAIDTDGWQEERNGQCVALNGRRERCTQLTHPDAPFCGRHLDNLVRFMSTTLEPRVRREVLQSVPEVFRYVVNVAREADVLDVLRRGQSAVYFLGIEDVVKIGYSTNPPARVASLRSKGATLAPEGYDLKAAVLLGTTPGGRKLEHRLHDILGDHRICGEWFVRSPEVNEVISHFIDGTPTPLMETHMRRLRELEASA